MARSSSLRTLPDVAIRWLLASALVALCLPMLQGCASAGARAGAQVPRRVELLGEARIPSLDVNGTKLGGLSGISWLRDDEYIAVTDDKSEHGPARYYRLTVRVDGELGRSGRRIRVNVRDWVAARQAGGEVLAPERADLEGIASRGVDEVFLSSEGWGERGIPPFVTRLSADGSWREDLPLPAGFAPAADGKSGVRPNLAFESLTVTPDRRYLFTATENALLQDGPASDAGVSSPARLLRYDLETGAWDRQWLYRVEPPRFRPQPGAARVAGLVDLAAIDEANLLALERSFEKGRGYDERLFAVAIDHADDVSLR